MAAKKNILVGRTVTFIDRDGKRKSGKVLKKNVKTARVKVARCGEFLISYNLLKPAGEIERVAPVKKPAAKKPRQKATGKKVCAVPVAKRSCAPKKRPKKNPDNDPLGRKAWTPKEDAKLDYARGVYAPKSGFKGYLDEYRLEYELLERAYGRKNPPRPYKFGMESKKARRKAGGWGDPAAFATTHPDDYERYDTQEFDPERTRPNPPRGARRGTPGPMSEAELARYTPEQRARYREAYAYYSALEKRVDHRQERPGYAARMAEAALLYPEGRYWDK